MGLNAVRFYARHSSKSKKQTRSPIILPEYISVSNLANLLAVRYEALSKRMLRLGFGQSETQHNYSLDRDMATLISEEFNVPIVSESSLDKHDLFPQPYPDEKLLKPRPPIVTIMGHVDHGKTSLLDYLRNSSIVSQEHGGITQHIGAFSVPLKSGKRITFIDTPGHAAFLSMRERGALITDIVVLVVAATESVMPQTIEAINHARKAKVPIVVAMSKTDLPGADIDKVTNDLLAQNVELESIGGDVQAVPISNVTGEGISELEDAIIAQADMLNLKSPVLNFPCQGWIIEANMKKGCGNVATVLIREGQLKIGSILVAGTSLCKVKGMSSAQGVPQKVAGPGSAVEVMGWKTLPEAGDQVLQAKNIEIARKAVDVRETRIAMKSQADILVKRNESLEQIQDSSTTTETETKRLLNCIIKADVSGSAEAVSHMLENLGNDKVGVRILEAAVGPVTEFDVSRAEAANAVIYSFNLKNEKDVIFLAEQHKVMIADFNIIYKLVDDATERLISMLDIEYDKKILGEAEIRAIFPITVGKKTMNVAGCRISNGSIQRNNLIQTLRNDEVVYDGKLSSLKVVKKDIDEVTKGNDCGMAFEDYTDFSVGDIVQAYEKIPRPRYL
ncbi:hypothetical protein CANCADRAFT_2008 [Tortispora caseinolytica NRRL Y-17796]|uniref:Translation initiation factor IF-2, mitochondrial n=1 Tax=Tortispora caseinolytica NRRL Y-17796 TaxID=767744 RepID=A0A1E4TET0_9ASCO|nr:hypothetical protein CANCADRAFT_2008 [Tortispora caseinolytica NRRL Y-17796]